MDELTDSVKVDVSSGHVELDLPSDANFTLNGEVNSGAFRIDLPLKINRKISVNLRGYMDQVSII